MKINIKIQEKRKNRSFYLLPSELEKVTTLRKAGIPITKLIGEFISELHKKLLFIQNEPRDKDGRRIDQIMFPIGLLVRPKKKLMN